MTTTLEVIRQRRSVRRYEERKLSEATLGEILKAGEESPALVEGADAEFRLVNDAAAFGKQLMGLAGRYGQVIQAPHFVVALAPEKPGFMENIGFRMEPLILKATALGFGTCWVGGMWKETKIHKFLKADPGQRVVALSPLGHPDQKIAGRLVNRAMKVSAPGQGRRQPLDRIVYLERWGRSLSGAPALPKALADALEGARLAPSYGNLQPWRFIVTEDRTIATAAQRRHGLLENVKEGKPYYRLDVGIAMQHLQAVYNEESGKSEGWDVSGFDAKELAARHGVDVHAEILGVFPAGLQG